MKLDTFVNIADDAFRQNYNVGKKFTNFELVTKNLVAFMKEPTENPMNENFRNHAHNFHTWDILQLPYLNMSLQLPMQALGYEWGKHACNERIICAHSVDARSNPC